MPVSDDVNALSNKDTSYDTPTLPLANHTTAVPPPNPHNTQRVNADSGTTGHYFALKDMNCLRDVKPVEAHKSVTVTMPNGQEITSSHTGKLNYPNITNGNEVHIFKTLWGSLLSIGELCDTGLTAVFTANAVYIVDADNEVVVLSGERDPTTRLWMIALTPITPKNEHIALRQAQAAVWKKSRNSTPPVSDQGQANGASVQKLDNSGDRVEFFSRVFSSMAEPTIMQAIKRNWIKFPGITLRILKQQRHRLRTHESAAGHLDQVHQNHQPSAQPVKEFTPSPEHDLKPTTILTYSYRQEGNHMDATGRYPIISHQGHQYMLIMYSEAGNYIKVLPMKDRSKTSYLKAHKEGLDWYDSRGYKPTFQRMDNETSIEFANHLRTHNIDIDLAPPHMHRRNKAERAIRTWKNHFIATIAGVDPNFPMCAWNELIPQAEMTINMVRISPSHPRMSAWEAIHGSYDFDAHPMAPPGTAITIHEKPSQRKSWSKHGVKGFYLGPAMEHYRCYNVWTSHSGTSRVADTVAWHPHGYQWESYSPLEMITHTVETLSEALKQLANSDTTAATHRQPLKHIAYDIMSNFEALKAVFQPQDNTTQDERVPAAITEDPHAVQRVSAPTATPSAPVQRVPAPTAVATPPRRSERRKHQWLNRPPAHTRIAAAAARAAKTINEARLSYKERRAIMIAERAAGKPVRRERTHSTTPPDTTINWDASPAPRRTYSANQALRKAKSLLAKRASWARWAEAFPDLQLDANGRPFFLNCANTAADLDEKGQKLSMTTALAGPDGHLWLEKHGEEIIRLFTSETIRLIHWHDLPAGAKPAYYNPQVRTKVKDGILKRRVRGTIGGDKVTYDGDTAANTASMQLIKIMLNSVVSDKGAKFMTADISDFYLGTPLPDTVYMRIKLDHIPQAVIDQYDMATYAKHGAVVVAVMKGIYGLPQAGILAQDRLVKHLAAHGYRQAKHTPCLFKHVSNSVTFTLVVDDFGIKYTRDADADHLMTTLRKLYRMTEDRSTQQKYVGITIEHDRKARTIQLSMPGYVQKALTRFGQPKKPGAKSPLTYTPPRYGPEQQMVPDVPDTALQYVDAKTTTFVQEVTGVFLFYSRAVDPTMLTAVNKISSEQAKPTQATLEAVDRLLSYAARYPNAIIIIQASDMQLCVQSDASYLSERGARSRAGAILYFGLTDDGNVNGAIDYISTIIQTVCSSVAEAEYAAIFLAGRETINARNILQDLGYPQKTTPFLCDNACAVGLANNTVKQKRSKAIDMRYHWTRDQVQQGKFSITWEEGAANLADYFTKAHPVHHHINMRHKYVHTPKPLFIKQCARSTRIQHRINYAKH